MCVHVCEYSLTWHSFCIALHIAFSSKKIEKEDKRREKTRKEEKKGGKKSLRKKFFLLNCTEANQIKWDLGCCCVRKKKMQWIARCIAYRIACCCFAGVHINSSLKIYGVQDEALLFVCCNAMVVGVWCICKLIMMMIMISEWRSVGREIKKRFLLM